VPDRWLIHIAPEDETLGDMVSRLRRARGWSQSRLAREISRPGENIASLQSLVTRYENERITRPSGDMLERFARVFELPRRDVEFAAFQSSLRRERQPIPPNSVVIGPAVPALVDVLRALDTIEDDELADVAKHIRLIAEGRPPAKAQRDAS
jgi:transcriptional regulator with XRE-family HTH domain